MKKKMKKKGLSFVSSGDSQCAKQKYKHTVDIGLIFYYQ